MNAISKIVAAFIVGLGIGWFLYPVFNIDQPDDLAEVQGESAEESPQTNLESTSESLELNVSEQILAGNYAQAVHDCLERIAPYTEGRCRAQIFETLNLVAHNEARLTLEIWLNGMPGDIDAGILLAELQDVDGESAEAIRSLYELRSYLDDAPDIDRVNRKIDEISQSVIKTLEKEKDRGGLLKIYEVLSEGEPENALWRLNLAKTQMQLKQYENAINSLSFILYDVVYGKQAESLYEEINQRLDLSNYVQVPITRLGKHYLIDVLLNDSHTVNLLIDTGASITLIKQSALARLGVATQSERKIILNTAGGQVDSFLLKVEKLDVGGQVIKDIDIAVLPLQQEQADGLLGMNFLENFRFIIDQKQNLLLLSPR